MHAQKHPGQNNAPQSKRFSPWQASTIATPMVLESHGAESESTHLFMSAAPKYFLLLNRTILAPPALVGSDDKMRPRWSVGRGRGPEIYLRTSPGTVRQRLFVRVKNAVCARSLSAIRGSEPNTKTRLEQPRTQLRSSSGAPYVGEASVDPLWKSGRSSSSWLFTTRCRTKKSTQTVFQALQLYRCVKPAIGG